MCFEAEGAWQKVKHAAIFLAGDVVVFGVSAASWPPHYAKGV